MGYISQILPPKSHGSLRKQKKKIIITRSSEYLYENSIFQSQQDSWAYEFEVIVTACKRPWKAQVKQNVIIENRCEHEVPPVAESCWHLEAAEGRRANFL